MSSTWTCWKNIKNCLHLGKLLRIYIIGMSPLFDQKFWTYIMIKAIFWHFFSLWQLIPDFMTWKFSVIWRFVNLLPPNQRKKKQKKTKPRDPRLWVSENPGVIKLSILIDPSWTSLLFTCNQLSDLWPRVEKKMFKEIH